MCSSQSRRWYAHYSLKYAMIAILFSATIFALYRTYVYVPCSRTISSRDVDVLVTSTTELLKVGGAFEKLGYDIDRLTISSETGTARTYFETEYVESIIEITASRKTLQSLECRNQTPSQLGNDGVIERIRSQISGISITSASGEKPFPGHPRMKLHMPGYNDKGSEAICLCSIEMEHSFLFFYFQLDEKHGKWAITESILKGFASHRSPEYLENNG